MGNLHSALVALVMATWQLIHPALPGKKDAPLIAEAIATVIEEDAENAPIFNSHAEDAVVMAYWAFRESGLNTHIIGDGGRSFGFLQQRSASAHGDETVQARAWLYLLRRGLTFCPVSPSAIMWGLCSEKTRKMANDRIRNARKLEIAVIQ